LESLGQKQAQATAQYVANRWPIAAVYAGPLKRTMQTAQPIAQAQGLSVKPMDALIDINFGKFQGLLAKEAQKDYPNLFQAWVEAPHTVHFPDGESLVIVRQRVKTALSELNTLHTGQTIALVSHTVVNRVILCIALDWENDRFWRMHQHTCAVNVFDIEDDGSFTIVLLNDTSHLQHIQE
jgi:broad specificity phosphatase PhoE